MLLNPVDAAFIAIGIMLYNFYEILLLVYFTTPTVTRVM